MTRGGAHGSKGRANTVADRPIDAIAGRTISAQGVPLSWSMDFRLRQLQARHRRVAEIIEAIEPDRKPMQLQYIGVPQ